ncbi:MAG: ABC transporter permease subunit [Oscillospiraceae bacterium]|nr:ABC transporter permease subunit [Oscillospiraceae bacterium]
MKKSRIFSTLYIVLICVYLILPLLLTGVYSFFDRWTDILPTGFTTEYYQRLFADPAFVPSIVRGLVICVPAIIISVICVLLALYTAVIYLPKLEKYIQLLCTIPQTIQGVVLAISLLSLYAGSNGPLGNRIVMLIGAYSIMILPFVYSGLRNSMYAVNTKQLIEAAEILGASKFTSFLRIVVPCMKSGVMVASLISMAIIFGDFAVIKLVASSQWKTAMMVLYNMRVAPGQLSSAIIIILFLIILVLSFSALALQNKERKQEVFEKVEEE